MSSPAWLGHESTAVTARYVDPHAELFRNSADLCRGLGFTPGTLIESLARPGLDGVRIEITAIGQEHVLGLLRAILWPQQGGGLDWEPWDGDEQEELMDLTSRAWRRVEQHGS